VGEEIALALLDAVLHLASGAVNRLVEEAGLVLFRRQRGDDEARIGLALGPLGFGDDAAPAAPAVARRPHEVLEASRRLAGSLALLLGLAELGRDLVDEPGVAGKTEEEVDAVGLAPCHQVVAGEAAVGAQQDPHLWPAPADLPNDARHLLDR